MIVWELLNSLGRLGLTVLSAYVVYSLHDRLNLLQRVGLGCVGGGSLLTIDVIWNRAHSPYDGWSGTVVTYGILLFLLGTGRRYWQHERANQIMIERARQWQEQRR